MENGHGGVRSIMVCPIETVSQRSDRCRPTDHREMSEAVKALSVVVVPCE